RPPADQPPPPRRAPGRHVSAAQHATSSARSSARPSTTTGADCKTLEIGAIIDPIPTNRRRSRMMRTLVTLCVAALLVVAGGAPTGQAQTPDTLVVAQGPDMQTGDPHKTTLTHAVNVLVNLYDTLVSRDASLALKPGLALSWRSVDPTTWEFKLRQGVKFHNGEPFNAQAVKYSFDRMQAPKTKWPGAAAIRLTKSVTVVDDATVRLTTERPWPLLPRYLGYYGMIVPPKLTESSEDALVRHPV